MAEHKLTIYQMFYKEKWGPAVICTDLMRSFSRGLLSTTTQGLSDSAGLGEGMEGDLDGDGLPTTFLLVLGVASLFWTRWGKRSLRICSRSSSTIWGKIKSHNRLKERKCTTAAHSIFHRVYRCVHCLPSYANHCHHALIDLKVFHKLTCICLYLFHF